MDAYELGYDERVALVLAEVHATKTCAARFDIDFSIPADVAIASVLVPGTYDANKNRHAYRYGHNDLDVVREHGYVLPAGLPEEPSTEWLSPTQDDLYAWVVINGLEPGPQPPELSGASGHITSSYPTGVTRPTDRAGNPLPRGGCGGEAVSILVGDGQVYDDIYVENLNNEPYFLAEEDSRVLAVTEAWSACMKDKGYDYSSPEEPPVDPAWYDAGADGTNAEPRQPTPEEIVTAVADVECQQAVNYLGVRVAVESAYQEQVIEEHFQDLELNYANAQAMLERANAAAASAS